MMNKRMRRGHTWALSAMIALVALAATAEAKTTSPRACGSIVVGSPSFAQRNRCGLDKPEPRQSALARQLPEAGKEEAAAFERAKRQERATLAREVLTELRQQDLARERQRERGRDRGMER
jgi:hypothetical protein